MRTFLLCFLALTLSCHAQFTSTLNDKSAKGSFYVSVDDHATIYINGQQFYHCDIGESRSPETELKTGDRIVVHLKEDGGGKRFMFLFASTDGQTVVSFRAHDLKIVPELEATDFTPDQLQKWTKFAKQEHHKHVFPVKGYSDWMWGDLDKCILAGTVTSQMFSQRPK